MNRVIPVLMVAAVLVAIVHMGLDVANSILKYGEVESFEVNRGDHSLTCVTAWAGTQATMSCLPTQWMEAEVTYDQADFEAPAP